MGAESQGDISLAFSVGPLGSFVEFKNGKSSPDRLDSGEFPVFGSNGLIGKADSTNAMAGTLVVGRVGSYCGSVHYSPSRCWVTDNAIIGSSRSSSDSRFWYYKLKSLNLNNYRAGSGQPLLNQQILNAIQVSVPATSEARIHIAGVLGDLDDKIDLNRRVNQTLEAMAQAIFKSWFIDFDPVKAKIVAKAEGRDPLRAAMTAISGKTDAELDTLPPDQFAPLAATAALFPDEMEDSELGEIPKGWCCDTFGSIAELSKGSVNPLLSPERVFEHFSLPAFDAGKQPVVEEGAQIKSNKTKFARGAVLQSKLNPHIPRVWFPLRVSENAVCSTEFLPWIAKEPASPSFLYCLLTSDPFGVQVRSLVTGTSNSHQRVKPDQVSGLLTVVPPKDLLSAFTKTVDPFFERVESGTSQMRDLASLRDALLPKLLSGELHVRGAEAEAAA